MSAAKPGSAAGRTRGARRRAAAPSVAAAASSHALPPPQRAAKQRSTKEGDAAAVAPFTAAASFPTALPPSTADELTAIKQRIADVEQEIKDTKADRDACQKGDALWLRYDDRLARLEGELMQLRTEKERLHAELKDARDELKRKVALERSSAASTDSDSSRSLYVIMEEVNKRLEDLRIPKHTIQVQGWSGQPTFYLHVSSYSELIAQTCNLFGIALASVVLRPTNFTFYYIPPGLAPDAQLAAWFREKKKVSSDIELQLYLSSFPAHARHPLLLWVPPTAVADPSSSASAVPAVRAAVPSPTKDQAPVLQPPQAAFLGDAVSIASSASSRSSATSATSRDSAVQGVFAAAVRVRDGWQCIVCRDASVTSVELQAAHVVPVSGERADQMRVAGLSNVYDTRNGYVLCVSCHFFHDRGLWCIDPTNRSLMLVTDALAQRRPQEWSQRQGQPVMHADPFHPDWPTQQTLQVQHDFMVGQTAERHVEQAKRKFECPYCGKRYASDTSTHFTRHVREHAGEPKGQWTVFHTPQKHKK